MDGFTLLLVGLVIGLLVAMSMARSNDIHVYPSNDRETEPPLGCAGLIWFVAFAVIILLTLLGTSTNAFGGSP